MASSLEADLKAIEKGTHGDPFKVLGPQKGPDGKGMVRVWLPGAKSVSIVDSARKREMAPAERPGFFEAPYPMSRMGKPYKLHATYADGRSETFHDPYAFGPVITDFDLHLLGEGTHYDLCDKLGAHVRRVEGVRGTHFALWAPNAKGVSVVGDFNRWDGRTHQMRLRNGGIWEIFIPSIGDGTLYKFELRTKKGLFLKTDPLALRAELRPNTASVVHTLGSYKWDDRKWLDKRRRGDALNQPMSIYEMHPGSWMRSPDGQFVNYRDLAEALVEYVKRMGYTHIEIMPVMEHPLDDSWGYQTTGYFAITSRFGSPEDFMHFVDHCHASDIGVIIDWVPAHFPKDAHGLAFFDGTFLYEHEHPFMREHQDWGTHIFNYGRTEVANFLLSSALFWLRTYHIDGLRVDAVASMLYLDYSRKQGQWIPNKYGGNENLEAIAFIKRFNELCHKHYPGVLTIAEESTAWAMVSRPTYAGGLGFSLKWNMGWMHDVLEYFSKDPVHRKYHHHSLTFSMIYAFNENFVLVLSHDEVVHGKRSILNKMPGDMWQKFANTRLLLGFMFAHPGKKMLFMGADIGQWDEWNVNRAIDWHLLRYEPHDKLQSYVQDLNMLHRREPSMHELDFSPEGFQWLDYSDSVNSVVSFIRKASDPDDFLVFVFNFTPVPRQNYRIGVPLHAAYREIMNSDSELYYGSNAGNAGMVVSEKTPVNLWPQSLKLKLPPLGMLVLKPVHEDAEQAAAASEPEVKDQEDNKQ